MRQRKKYINDIKLDSKDTKSRNVTEIKSYIEPETKIERPIAGTIYDRRCKMRPIHLEAIKILREAGWTFSQISIALGFSKTSIHNNLHNIKKPRLKAPKKTPDYWKEKNRAKRIYRKELEEEGLI